MILERQEVILERQQKVILERQQEVILERQQEVIPERQQEVILATSGAVFSPQRSNKRLQAFSRRVKLASVVSHCGGFTQ